jgi:hypothetical protein
LWAGFAFDITPTLSFWTGALIQAIAFAFSLRILARSIGSIEPTPITNVISSPANLQD